MFETRIRIEVKEFFRLRLSNMMKMYGMTIGELAYQIGVTYHCAYYWVRGVNLPTENNLVKISMIFGVKKEYFIMEEYYTAIRKMLHKDYNSAGDRRERGREDSAAPIAYRNYIQIPLVK